MIFAPPRPDPILARRLGGLALSAALHATAIALSLSSLANAPAPGLQAASPESAAIPAIAVVHAPPPATSSVGALPRRPALELAGIKVDLDKIRGAPADLFPFVLLDPVVLAGHVSRDGDSALTNPLVADAGGDGGRPLRISDRELQALVDRAWSRRERWRPFASIGDLVESHDGNHGRAAELLRAYTDQNLLQPYYDGDALDARYWTMLGLAADHRTFVSRISAYLRHRPHTRVAIELLFLLDELVQGSRDTLLMVIANDPAAALRRSAAEQPAAYARAEVLYSQTREWLKRQGLDEHDKLRRRLDDVRLDILRLIVERPDGYRTADARYLMGVIYFERRERERAAAVWTGAVRGSHDLYAEALSDVQAALLLPPERRAAALVAALGAEHGRWLDFSERRLRRFGLRPADF